MKKILALLLCLVLCLSGCSVRFDKTTAFKKYSDKDKARRIDELCRSFFTENGVCGLSVGILDGFEVKFLNYGKTAEGGLPVTEDTVYPLGRLTEMFTGVMWAEWEKREWFTPTTETVIYFPYTPMPSFDGKNFNSFHLATHTSALPELPDNFTDYGSYDDLALRRYLSSSELSREPGISYSHSETGYGLLGYLLETRLKQPYEVLVKNSIMYRCSMTSTTVTLTEEQEKSAALPHASDGRELALQTPDACLQGAVGFRSTAYDMLIFASLNLAKVDVSTFLERAITLAHEKHYEDEAVTLGYGFRIEPTETGNFYFQQSCQNGAASFFGVDDGSETAVCILCNTEKDVSPLAEQIMSILNS